MNPFLITIAVLFVIGLTIYMLKKGINVGLVMLIDSAILVVLARIPFLTSLKLAFSGLTSDKTIQTILIMTLIMMLENIMRISGTIKRVVESLKELVGSNRLAASLLPVVLGLLPSPGGARFSCPMVEEVTGKNTDGENKAFINYWFRHVWMDAFLLYPGIILASSLLDVSVINFFVHMIPFILITAVLGIIFGLRKVKAESIIKTRPRSESLKIFIISILPIIIVLAIYMLLLNYTVYSLEIASGAVVVGLFVIKKYSIKQIANTVKTSFPVNIVIIIVGVMIFKEVLFGSGIMEGLPVFMKVHNIPVGILFMLLPFIGGVSSGITVSYVSMSFPILITLGLGENIWYGVLAYSAGYIGNMITPLHLCAIMTADYFKSPMGKLLARVALAESVLAVILVATLIFIML